MDANIRKRIGAEVAKKRIELGIKQGVVAKQVELSRSYLSDLESGRYAPSVETLAKLAKVLEIDFNFLLQMTEIHE